jgi:hypothetical protein
MIATQLRPSPDNAQRDRLVGVAAKAFDFEVVIPGIQGVTERRGWLSRSMKAGIRLFHASHAKRSAVLRASAACSAAARIDAP